jgi:hypothetical protein
LDHINETIEFMHKRELETLTFFEQQDVAIQNQTKEIPNDPEQVNEIVQTLQKQEQEYKKLLEVMDELIKNLQENDKDVNQSNDINKEQLMW